MEAAQSFQPFDRHRILLGDRTGLLFLLEIVFRTAVMYGYALAFARFIGKRGVGQVSPFEFILIIISSAAGDPMFYSDVLLLHGILVLTVVMLLHRLVGVWTDRSERAEDVIEGEPILVIADGEIVDGALAAGDAVAARTFNATAPAGRARRGRGRAGHLRAERQDQRAASPPRQADGIDPTRRFRLQDELRRAAAKFPPAAPEPMAERLGRGQSRC